MEQTWSEVLWAIAEGKKTEYDSLKATEIREFFRVLRTHEKRISQMTSKIQDANG